MHELDSLEASCADQQVKLRLHVYDFTVVILDFDLVLGNVIDGTSFQIYIGQTQGWEVVIGDDDAFAV